MPAGRTAGMKPAARWQIVFAPVTKRKYHPFHALPARPLGPTEKSL
jgi:hypothetical protein